MITDQTLARAVSEGIITPAQADGLRVLQSTATPPAMNAWSEPAPRSPDDESLRFVSGFGDIFVVIGLALFFGAAGYFLRRFFGATMMWVGLAALAWLLAEFFTRNRRMALPSIVLLGLFACSVFAAATQAIAGWNPFALLLRYGLAGNDLVVWSVWLAGLATAAAAGLHYWRFRVPITIAAAAAALAASAIGLFATLWPDPDRRAFNAVVLLCGLVIFAVAMRVDSADPERLTRRTDIAFWLHLLAAPLIVHPVISSLLKTHAQVEAGGAIAILAIFLVFAFVAVAIDRRAMLVSGLTYAGIAFGTLLRRTGFSDFTVPATLLALGAFVLLLSAGWQPLRRAVLQLFPASMLRRLPRPLHRPS